MSKVCQAGVLQGYVAERREEAPGPWGTLHREAHFWEQQAVTSDYSLRPGPALLNDIQEGSSNLSPKGLRAGAAQRTAVLSTHV